VISRFFIDRPIFAWVISIVITLAGGVAVFSLPIAQYPPITPPSIIVSCNYPGASAQVVAESVAAPIEQQVNGVENMLYMQSQCTNDGSYQLTVTFKPGVNLNFAQVLVQNRVNLAMPQLPDVVKATGVTTRKRSPDILLIISLYAKDGRYDQLYLSNYLTIQVRDEICRVDGVGDVFLFGQQDYSMRVWVDPQQLAIRGVSAAEVVAALRVQNVQVATGHLGQEPVPPGQRFQYTLATLGRLSEPEQFDNVIVKVGPEGNYIRIKDIGHVELAAKSQDISARLDGKPCSSLAVFQLPDANALDTADRVRAKMEELKASFPDAIDYEIAFDTTPYIRESVSEVFNTLRDAVILVALVVLLFLQDWKAMILPMIDVPVSLIGTFAVMALMGFTLNNLTLFGMVLAIGIVVDDAIVVLENIERQIATGLDPRSATIKAMDEIAGPILAITLVLSSVFLPCAFISGITGQFFRQFALTIAVSMIISAINAMTLTPSRAVVIFKTESDSALHGHRREALPWWIFGVLGGWLSYRWGWQHVDFRLALTGLSPSLLSWLNSALFIAPGALVGGLIGWFLIRPVNAVLGWLFRGFNRLFDRATDVYGWAVGWALRGCVLVLVLYGGLMLLTGYGFMRLPTGYIPVQDKGYLLVAVQLPDASSLERTQDVIDRIDRIARDTPGVAHTIYTAGQSFTLQAYGSNFGNFFIPLKDFDKRRDPKLYSDNIAADLKGRIAREVPEAQVAIFGPPPVNGLGTAGGFKFIIEDRGEYGLEELQKQTEQFIAKANKTPGLSGLFTVFRANAPQLFVDVNRDQCFAMNVQLSDVFATLQVYLGSLYVNDFNKFGRTWQVVVQAAARFRDEVEDVKRLLVPNKKGGMVPLGAVANVREINGPLILVRYNMFPAAAINGNTAPGYSSGQAIHLIDQMAAQDLPPGMTPEWTEIAYMQIQSGNTAMVIFALSVVLVFLVLAALYESWSLPLAVILVVPMCLLGSITGVALAHSDINIFTQIGFVVLVGLASKNAILIVEFAKAKREQGMECHQATLEASKMRLRPILMTSFAFILGVVPLMVSVGAGAEMRQALGTAVFSGMLGVTLFGIFLTPVFFFVVDRLSALPVFSSETSRLIGRLLLIGLGILTLGLFWLLLMLFRELRREEKVALALEHPEVEHRPESHT